MDQSNKCLDNRLHYQPKLTSLYHRGVLILFPRTVAISDRCNYVASFATKNTDMINLKRFAVKKNND